MRTLIIMLASVLALTACSKHADHRYTIDGITDAEGDVTLYDATSGAVLATSAVEGGKFHFDGTADTVRAVLLAQGKNQRIIAFLEPGAMQANLAAGYTTGTPLNDDDAAMTQLLNGLESRLAQGETFDFDGEAKAALKDLLARHPNDALGAYYFSAMAAELYNLDEMEAYLANAGEALREDPTIKRMLNAKHVQQATAPGKPYADVVGQDATSPDKALKLSDIAGKGKPTLVDFWASWCGPCRREIPYIKANAEKYAGRVNVVGIAVWDKVPDTQQAIGELGITWPVILNEREATDAYGVQGIPHIILIDGDGTIVARDLRGAAIGAAIESLLNK